VSKPISTMGKQLHLVKAKEKQTSTLQHANQQTHPFSIKKCND